MMKKRLSKREERYTAYHEAGHAVAHYLFGQEIDFITIVPDYEKGEFGRVQPKGAKTFRPVERLNHAPTIVDARLDFEREIIIYLAGYVAEVNYRGGNKGGNCGMVAKINFLRFGSNIKLDSPDDPTMDNDLDKVRAFFTCFFSLHHNVVDKNSENDAYLRWLWFRTVNIITTKETWAAVKALATTLLEKKRLTGSQAKKIMSKLVSYRMSSLLHLTGEKAKEILREDNTRIKPIPAEEVIVINGLKILTRKHRLTPDELR